MISKPGYHHLGSDLYTLRKEREMKARRGRKPEEREEREGKKITKEEQIRKRTRTLFFFHLFLLVGG